MKTIRISLPKSWNELSDRQLQKVALLFNTRNVDRLFHLQLFLILGDVRWWQLRKAWKYFSILQEVPLSELREHYAFIYKQNDRTKFLPYLKTKKETFFSPMDRLGNLSAEEFAAAEDFHQSWHKERKRIYLEYLAAVLYSTAPNIRPPHQKYALHVKAALFKKVKLEKLLAMELAYFGCKNLIAARYPKVFPKSVSVSPRKGKKYGFGKVILNMAGGKFGDHDKTKQTNIYTLLEEFEEILSAK